MNETAIIVSTLAILFSLIALIVGCVAIAMVSGFLRSTHTIQWKTLDNPFVPEGEEELEEDQMTDLAKLKKEINRPKDFAFMEDIAETNNF